MCPFVASCEESNPVLFSNSEDITDKCREAQFLRVDQSVLVGFALNVSIQRTLEGCMDACLRETTFVCKVRSISLLLPAFLKRKIKNEILINFCLNHSLL